jgi:hypothetical protein
VAALCLDVDLPEREKAWNTHDDSLGTNCDKRKGRLEGSKPKPSSS